MFFANFRDHHQDIADKETKSFEVLEHHAIPNGKYALLEAFCNKKGCDCRRVYLSVLSLETGSTEAVINFGWEQERFYARWLDTKNKNTIKLMKGPSLNPGSPTTNISHDLLEVVSEILQDKGYVQRIIKHYSIFRREIEEKSTNEIQHQKTGRNSLCPCGSNIKYKKCCLN